MIIAKTPFRVSFFGGGTDYPEHFVENGGAVLGTAIDKYAYHLISGFHSKLFDYNLRIAYSKVECVSDVENIMHTPFKECLKHMGITRDIEVDYQAELPSFSGLGTSSTFVVGLLNALNCYKNQIITPEELAYKAINMERNILNEAVGCQDQAFAAVGGLNVIEFFKEDKMKVHAIPIDSKRKEEFESQLVMVYTNIPRKSVDYAQKQIKNVALNKESLLDMRIMVDKGYDILVNNRPIEEFGLLLHEGWVKKRNLDNSISNSVVDDIYKFGRDNGAVGGKLLGAGGGGFVLFCVPPEKQKQFREKMSNYEILDIKVDAPGSTIIHK